MKVTVKIGIITVLDKSYDLCDVVKDAGKSCPFSAGSATISITEAIPDIEVPGTVRYTNLLY